MINVSREFQRLMNERTDFKQNAEITFADGTVLELKEKDFTISNNSVVDGSDTNGIPLGVAVCRNIQIELMNDDDRFSTYDFFGAVIRLYLTFQLSETVERIEYGTFTVLTPETYGSTVIITALDDMYKADCDYHTNLVFPVTIRSMLRDACTTLGISQGTTTFLNDTFVVKEKPTDITFRQLFGYIAMIAGGNTRIDRTGRLQIQTYDFSNMDSLNEFVVSGGVYKPWNNPANFDGGSFYPWNEGDSLDGGNFTDLEHFHFLSNWKDLKIDTDDVVITGVQTTYTDEEDEEKTAICGEEGYVLVIDNPLIVGQEEDAVGLIGNVVVGGRFRQFSGDIVANPTCEFMDPVLLFDRKGNVYSSFITDVNFQFFGFTSIKNSAEPTLRNSAKAYSEAVKTLVKARKLIKKERSAREQAVAQLAKDLKNSSGLFMTQEVQKDGSIIYYMHDKPILEDSLIRWKLTAQAFAVSTDGGKNWPYGFSADGTTIVGLLYANGIDATYINAGAISIDDGKGNAIFTADYDTKEVYIDADNVTINGLIKAINNDTSTTINGGKIKTGSITATQIKAGTITGNKLNVDSVAAKLINAESFTSKYATITKLNATSASLQELISDKASIKALNAATAKIESLETNKIDASTVKADYMEVKNWTSSGKIKADKIDVDSLFASFSSSTVLNVGLLSTSTLQVSEYEFTPTYSSTVGGYILLGKKHGT